MVLDESTAMLDPDGRKAVIEIMERLNRELTDELCIVDAYVAERKFLDIAWADYTCEIFCDGASDALAAETEKLFSSSPLNMIKSTKSGEKEIDIILYKILQTF